MVVGYSAHFRNLVAARDGRVDNELCRVDQNHIIIRIYGVHTVFLAGKSPYIRSYTVYIYGSGQPYQ